MTVANTADKALDKRTRPRTVHDSRNPQDACGVTSWSAAPSLDRTRLPLCSAAIGLGRGVVQVRL